VRRQLLELAQENARHAFEEKRRAEQDIEERLGRLQARLRLPVLPRHIECIDISHLAGQDTYGSIVALKDGLPNKRDYRSYRVKTATAGDDYAAIYEVLSRRFVRGQRAREAAHEEGAGTPPSTKDSAADVSGGRAAWALPDLLVVDGGRGQLAVALAAAHDLGLRDLSIVGLAKEKENVQGEKLIDRVYLPGQKNPLGLKPNAPELFWLARARDEAHRFANRMRKKAGKRRRFASALDGVAGIGPKTRQLLLQHVGGPERLQSASDEELLAIEGVGARHVRALRAHFAARSRAEVAAEAGATAAGPGVRAVPAVEGAASKVDTNGAADGSDGTAPV
jgi:excinuclease ABC subunit C